MRKKLKYSIAKHNKWIYLKERKLKSFIIACEDSVSSPTYFNTFLQRLKDKNKISQDSLIVPHAGRTHPTGVLKTLLLFKNSKGKDFSSYDYRFIIIDRDKEKFQGAGHSKKDFNLALKKAQKYKVKVIYANPSFELWYLLHLEHLTKSLDRFEVIDELIVKLKNLSYKNFHYLSHTNIKSHKTTLLIAKEIKKFYKKAVENALFLERLYSKKRRISPERDNPSTNIHELTTLFEEILKRK